MQAELGERMQGGARRANASFLRMQAIRRANASQAELGERLQAFCDCKPYGERMQAELGERLQAFCEC
jgi:hypothetical protein